jgi:hypothetical protein
MGKGIRNLLVLALVLSLTAVAPSSATASSGEITKAFVSSDWLHGDFAGTVTRSGCAAGGPRTVGCTWTPYAAVASGDSAEACTAPNREIVWEGQQGGESTQSFEVIGFSLDGNPGKVLCLGLIETITAELPCVPPGEPIPPGWHCPYKTSSTDVRLAAKVLEASAEPGRPHGTSSEAEPPKLATQGCRRGSDKRQGRCIGRRHHRIWVSQRQEVPKS